MAVDRVRRGGTDDQKRNPTRSRLKRGVGVGGTRQGGAGINKVSCKFLVTLFGCRVGGDVGQLASVLDGGRASRVASSLPTHDVCAWRSGQYCKI